MNKVAKLIVNFVLIVIIVVGVAVGNSIAFRYEGEINTLLAPPIVDEEAVQLSSSAGQEMSARIMEEGAVLLQNKDNTLPLDYDILEETDYEYPAGDNYFAYTTRGCPNHCSFCAVPPYQ